MDSREWLGKENKAVIAEMEEIQESLTPHWLREWQYTLSRGKYGSKRGRKKGDEGKGSAEKGKEEKAKVNRMTYSAEDQVAEARKAIQARQIARQREKEENAKL